MGMIGQVPPKRIADTEKSPDFGSWWMTWFNQAYTILFAAQSSGTTGQRPTTNLWVGRTFYDVSLGKPVWVNSVNPTVWKDASGSVV